MSLLTFSDGIIKMNGEAIDGILRSLSISGDVIFDDRKIDGVSGTKKVPMGWSDAEVSAVLDLVTNDAGTCYDKLTKLNTIFKSREDAPKVFEVSNRHLAARGIRKVVFAGLESSETSDDDVIAVTLKFTEDAPAVVKTEKGGSSGSASSSAAEPKAETSIMVDIK